MHIDKIKINNFKNYISATIYFDDKINFLYGKNGAGKTNLLDAIYYLSYGKRGNEVVKRWWKFILCVGVFMVT